MIKAKKSLTNISPKEENIYREDWRQKLDLNESIYGTSYNCVSSLKNLSEEDMSKYPQQGLLLDKITEKYNIQKENILLTNGLELANRLILETFLEKNEDIVAIDPISNDFLNYLLAFNIDYKLLKYDSDFSIHFDNILENIKTTTKIIFLACPNRVSGNIFKSSFLETLLTKFQNTLFVLDCSYINYSDSVNYMDFVDLISKYDNLLVYKSFSKDYGLAGLRIGFFVSNSYIINNLKKLSIKYNVNSVGLNCAISALNDYKKIETIKELNTNAKNALVSGLNDLGFKTYTSEANFILCDFKNYTDFYYEKLKKNGIIVKNFPKSSYVKTHLRITIPKIGGVKYILELLRKKNLLIFDLDGVIIDPTKSSYKAIIETYKKFTGNEISIQDIINIKNHGKMDYELDTLKSLFIKNNQEVKINEVIDYYNEIYYTSKKALINEEKLLISKDTLEILSKKYDLVLYSERERKSIDYSLQKFDIDKYFYYKLSYDDIEDKNKLKPAPDGVIKILNNCPYNNVRYLGDSVDDIVSGNMANIETIGVIPPYADNNIMLNNFKHLGATHILNNIKNLKNFIYDLEKNN